eukprot:1803185-Amphidinium_carterae.1
MARHRAYVASSAGCSGERAVASSASCSGEHAFAIAGVFAEETSSAGIEIEKGTDFGWNIAP